MRTTKQTGVWIDTRQAIILHLKGKEEMVEKIHSGIETRTRIEGEGKQYTRMGKQFFTFEKKKKEKLHHNFKKYFKIVLNKIKDSDSILIIGPAETKQALYKEMSRSKSLLSKLVMLDTKDSMTDRQVAAEIRNFFKAK